jgi:hypothetical protein
MKSTDMKFTEELRRRRAMNPEELAREADNFFIGKHNELAARIEEVLRKKYEGA